MEFNCCFGFKTKFIYRLQRPEGQSLLQNRSNAVHYGKTIHTSIQTYRLNRRFSFKTKFIYRLQRPEGQSAPK